MKRAVTKASAYLAILFVAVFAMALFLAPGATVQAQAQASSDTLLCRIFPFLQGIRFAESLCTSNPQSGAEEAVNTAGQLIQFGLSLVFVGIIAFAIFIIIKAAIKYIRSEGDESKVEEANKAIKNVFIGIGALIVGVIGLVIILGILSTGEGPIGTQDPPPNLFN